MQGVASALRSRSQNPKPRDRCARLSSAMSLVLFRRSAPGKASVLRSSAQRSVVVGASRRRAAPRNQSVGAPRTDGLARLAFAVHAAREEQQWRSCQRRCQRSCGRGLTGRSTGGATARRLARAAPFVYPAPRGQGVLPRRPGYLYVRPRRRHGPDSMNGQRASGLPADPGRIQRRRLSQSRLGAGSVQALRAGRGQRSPSLRPKISSGWHFAPACCAAQSVSGRTARGRLGSSCCSRARGARRRQRFGCQRRCKRRCGRGLTGQSTGGATAGCLARAAPFVYPAPRARQPAASPRLPLR